MTVHRNREFGYEFRHTLLRPTLLVVIAMGLLVALASGVQDAANAPAASRMFSAAAVYYDGAYRFDFFAFNGQGTGLAQVPFVVTITGYGNQTVYRNVSGATSTNGSLELSAALPEGLYEVSVTAGPQGSSNYWSEGPAGDDVTLGPLPPGKIVPLLNPLVWPLVVPEGFSGQPGVQVFVPDPDGSSVQALSVYYSVGDYSPNTGPAAEKNATLLGVLNTSHEFFPLVLTGTPAPVLIEIFSSNGTLAASYANSTANSYSLGQTWGLASNSEFTSYYSSDMFLLLPLMAVVASVGVYARDRSTGVLESTLVRPITALGLAGSRLLAVVSALLLSVGMGTLVADILIRGVAGSWVLPSFLIAFVLGAAICVGFFVGVVFAASHAFRSLMTVLAIGLGLYFLLDVFWHQFGLGIAGASSLFLLRFQLLSPVNYSSLAWASMTNVVPDFVYELSGPPASYGVGPWTVGLTGAVWALLPALALVALVRGRD